MIFDLTEQEHQYILGVLLERPVKEALPVVLKLSNQKLAPVEPPAPPTALRAVEPGV